MLCANSKKKMGLTLSNELETEEAKKEDELERIRERLVTLIERNKALLNIEDDMKQLGQNHLDEIVRMRQTQSHLETTISNQIEKLSTLGQTIDSQQMRIVDSQEHISELSQAAEQQQITIAEQADRIDYLQKEKLRVSSLLDVHEKQYEVVLKELNNERAERAKLEAEVDTQQDRIVEQNERLVELSLLTAEQAKQILEQSKQLDKLLSADPTEPEDESEDESPSPLLASDAVLELV